MELPNPTRLQSWVDEGDVTCRDRRGSEGTVIAAGVKLLPQKNHCAEYIRLLVLRTQNI